MEAIIVPCTSGKIWKLEPDAGPVAAKDAYTDPIFRRWRAHAEGSGCSWFILSTKYGLLRPTDKIESYNVSLSAALRDRSLKALLEQQGREFDLDSFEKVVLLDWEKFKPLVHAATRNLSVVRAFRRI